MGSANWRLQGQFPCSDGLAGGSWMIKECQRPDHKASMTSIKKFRINKSENFRIKLKYYIQIERKLFGRKWHDYLSSGQ
jgi:hypothetical protein